MKKKNEKLKFILPSVLLLCIFFLTAASIIYMAKDNIFFNTLYGYFRITPGMHRYLMLLPISQETLLRCINLSAVIYYFACLLFPLAINLSYRTRTFKVLIFSLSPLFIFQALLFEPSIIKLIYFSNSFLSADPGVFKNFYLYAGHFFHVLDYMCLCMSIVLFLRLYFTSPKLKLIRINIAIILISISILNSIFVYIFGWAPAQRLWMSRVASMVMFRPLPMVKPNSLFPYYYLMSIGILLIFCFAFMKYSRIIKRIEALEWEFNSRVDTAQTSVRAFCHYMKNQLLAVKAELESLQEKGEGEKTAPDESIAVIREICDESYERLNQVNNLVSYKYISLSAISFCDLLLEAVRTYDGNKRVRITCALPKSQPIVMGDGLLLKEAIENIINNAIEAMLSRPGENNVLDICCKIKNRWVAVDFKDNGPGIKEPDIDKIFDPFYSTKPISTNWGIGLALCKRIVLMHEGKIALTSDSKGTTFTLLLPHVN